jgi:hypothetical protein
LFPGSQRPCEREAGSFVGEDKTKASFFIGAVLLALPTKKSGGTSAPESEISTGTSQIAVPGRCGQGNQPAYGLLQYSKETSRARHVHYDFC